MERGFHVWNNGVGELGIPIWATRPQAQNVTGSPPSNICLSGWGGGGESPTKLGTGGWWCLQAEIRWSPGKAQARGNKVCLGV